MIIMSKLKLNTQDHERIMYWFHMAFKKKKPSNEDGETLKKVMVFAKADVNLVEETYDDPDGWHS